MPSAQFGSVNCFKSTMLNAISCCHLHKSVNKEQKYLCSLKSWLKREQGSVKETHSRRVSEISNLPFLISIRSRVDSGQEACTSLKQSFFSWERRGGLSFPGMSPRFGSLEPRLQSFCVFPATRVFSPPFAGVYMSDLFSSNFSPCLSHLRPPPPVVPPLSLTPHVTLAQHLGSWTERLLNSLTAQFVNAAPGYFRPLG